LRAYIDQRIAAGQVETSPEDEEPAESRSADILDMTALLKRSLERRQGKTTTEAPKPRPARKPAARKPAAKKAKPPTKRKRAA
jgi:non-homologous end joining protein Ku